MRFFAIFSDTVVYVLAADQPGASADDFTSPDDPEPLPLADFEARSVANGVWWKPADENMAVIDVDRYGETIMRTRFQLL